MTPADTLAEFLPPYIAEVEELLASARTHLVAADSSARTGSPHPRAVRELFRSVHTIKGLSAMVNVEPIVSIAHLMETALRVADSAAGRLEAAAFDVLHAGLTAIEVRLQAVTQKRSVPVPPVALIEALESLTAHEDAAALSTPAHLPIEPKLLAKLSASDREQLAQAVTAGQHAVRIDFTPTPDRASRGININKVRERFSGLGELVKVLPMTAPVNASAPGGLFFALLLVSHATDEELSAAAVSVESSYQPLAIAGASPPVAPPARAPAMELEFEEETSRQGVVRVESERLDDAMDRVGSLIVSRSRLLRAVEALRERGADIRELQQILGENGRLLRDMRASILRIRMVRVTEVLERLPLMIRGLRRTTGKQVTLEVEAGNAELDKAVGDRLFPAIVHLVRNAVDHALESPEERTRQGKPPEGTLRIDVRERSNAQLELTLRDDGRGVNAAAVAARAGVPVPTSDAALLELLCRPGLSTREEVTTTSGRGMGMDIVKRIAVGQLGGELRMTTEPGKGTTFTLRVPLTISIVDAFIFECGSQRYAAPVSTVEELVELDTARMLRPPSPDTGHGMGMIQRRGVAVPVVDLRGLLCGGSNQAALKAIVVQQHEQPVAFAVDRLVSQQEIVIRPLEDPLVRIRGISGATDLGDGKPVLVVDLGALGASFTTGSTPPRKVS